MIREWRVRNFKAVPWNAKEPLNLGALTVLVGPNSSGKSTLLQSILMVAQTLKNSSGERPLILNGELVKLGHAKEVLHEGDENQPLQIKFTLSGYKTSQANKTVSSDIQVDAEFTLPPNGNLGFDLSRAYIFKNETSGILAQKILSKKVITDLKFHPEWYVDPILKNQIEKGLFDYEVLRQSSSIVSMEPSSLASDPFGPKTSYFHFLPDKSLELYNRDAEFQASVMRYIADAMVGERNSPITESLIAIRLKDKQAHLLQESIRESIDRVIESFSRQIEKKGVYRQVDIRSSNTDQILRSLIFDLSNMENLNDWVAIACQRLHPVTQKKLAQQLRLDAAVIEVKAHQRTKRSEVRIGLRTNNLPEDIIAANREVIEFFTQRLRYLGPLRDDPRAIYGIPFNPETSDVGAKGEFTAAVLDRYKDEVISYPLPPLENVQIGEVGKDRLIVAVVEWLQYMDLVNSVSTNDLGKIGYEIKVQSKGVRKELDLTNVGVGVSQVLPTLVTSLLAPQDSIILLEQPELHLHPKVQFRLGDFILGVSLSGKQCIVETHSEYLLNRVRRRIVEAEGNTLLDKVSFYFVERGMNGAEFSRVHPNEYGAVLKWPTGFFEEGPAEANLILQAAMKKRKLSKQSN